ncbi:MAG: type II secretion system protein [Armatimonadetes bacterium]|nr:type II secretion system protein [Armatimonadota bacterium]
MRAIRRPGFTLLEILVVACLSLIVLTLIAQLLFPSFALFRSQMGFSEAHQSGMTAAARWKRELLNSMLATVTVGSEPTAISLVPVKESAPFDADGDPQLESEFVIYYRGDRDRLLRKTWPAPAEAVPAGLFDGPEPPRLSPEQLRDVCTSTNGTERVLARYVEEMAMEDGDGGDVALLRPPLRLRLTCGVPVGGEKFERFTVNLTACPQTLRW